MQRKKWVWGVDKWSPHPRICLPLPLPSPSFTFLSELAKHNVFQCIYVSWIQLSQVLLFMFYWFFFRLIDSKNSGIRLEYLWLNVVVLSWSQCIDIANFNYLVVFGVCRENIQHDHEITVGTIINFGLTAASSGLQLFCLNWRVKLGDKLKISFIWVCFKW